jgi:hypothetical protein
MKEMREKEERGDSAEEPKLDDLQSQEILLGLMSGVDVSLYADARYNFHQMEAIRVRLERGEDASDLLIYANS